MKKYLLLAGFLFLSSCGGSGGTPNITTQNLNTNNTVTSTEIDSNALKSYMTFDVLGGVFRKNSSATSAEIIDSESDTSVNKRIETVNTEPQPFEVDYSNQYVGSQGKGRMVISALGSGTELNDLRHFNALTLRFLFFNYAFNNPCVGSLSLDGELRCEITGDYKMGAKEFSGEAHCVNGPKANPISVLYITPQKVHEIGVDATLKIKGDFHRYKSYSYEGKITIDGEDLTIEDLIGRGGSCS